MPTLAHGILTNNGFEEGTINWTPGIGTFFHSIFEQSHLGLYCGRIQIPYSNYKSSTPSRMQISQIVQVNKHLKGFIFRGWSIIEQLFGSSENVTYQIEIVIHFIDRTKFETISKFSPYIHGWQLMSFTINISPKILVESVEVFCVLGAFRGAVYFDDLNLIEIN